MLSKINKPVYTFSLRIYGIYSWVNHVQGHTTSLNKFKKTEIISSILLDHNDIKLEVNHTHTHTHTHTQNLWGWQKHPYTHGK